MEIDFRNGTWNTQGRTQGGGGGRNIGAIYHRPIQAIEHFIMYDVSRFQGGKGLIVGTPNPLDPRLHIEYGIIEGLN